MYLKLFVIISICQSIFIFQISCATDWNYKENGPDEWPILFPGCNGDQQSPIDLLPSIAVHNPNLKPINFVNYNQKIRWNIKNNGDSIYGEILNATATPFISGSDFTEQYSLVNFHFHWGQNPYQGSEHQMNSTNYPLEIHMIHQSPSGKTAIIGFFYELSTISNSDLYPFLGAVGQAIYVNDALTKDINLVSILPDFTQANNEGYYRYAGSLAFPPCTQGVVWTVFRKTTPISYCQLKRFYSNKVEMNFRDVQPLNGRTLSISVKLD